LEVTTVVVQVMVVIVSSTGSRV